jgi:hypothetical protein
VAEAEWEGWWWMMVAVAVEGAVVKLEEGWG